MAAIGRIEGKKAKPLFLEMAVGLGARRGEVLALRWSDIVDGRAFISRSLTQIRGSLQRSISNGTDRLSRKTGQGRFSEAL